jgi:vancomycin resistance protein YoaR
VPVPSAPPPSAVDVTAVLPAQPAAEPAHGRSGSRGAHGGRRPQPAPVAETQGRHTGARTAQAAKTAKTAERAATATQATEKEAGGGQGSRTRTLTILSLCLAALVLLYGISLLVAGGVLSGSVPSGVSVDGVSLGGLSPAAARTALSTQLGPTAAKPIELQVGQTPVALDPAKAGLSLDVAGTVKAARSERTNPFTVIPALFGVGHPIDPVVKVDRTTLTTVLDTLASAYDSQLVEGKITFANGRPVVTAPREGRGFDVAAAVNAVVSGYLRVGGPIVLPVNALTPLATPEALQAALQNVARPAVSAPITIETDGVTTVLTPAQIGAALTIVPDQNGTMVPTLDGAMLRADLDPAALASETQGVNAAFTVVDGRPQLVPEKDGVGYSAKALSNAVLGALTKTGDGRTVTVARGPLPPAFTTADAQALGVQSVLGSSTLAVPEAADRAANTQHATSLVTGSVVQPGAVWSFDKTVGLPIAANGFAEPSGTGKDGVDASGADDLVATAVFDAAFRAGMGDTVHHPNAAYASRYPAGLDAAVVYPGTDLQWTNSGTHPVYVYASYANGSLTVAVLGRQAYDQVDVSVSGRQHVVAPTGSAVHGCPAQAAADGFQVDVTRVLTNAGQQVGTEQFHVAYVPFAGTTCGSSGTSAGSTSTGGASGTPGSGSGSAPTGGSTGSGSAGGGSGGGSPTTAPTSPTPAPTNTGVLGGLLH